MTTKKSSKTSQLELINADIMRDLRSWIENLIPGGKVKNHEYVVKNPTRPDASVGSFSINIENCQWSDFASQAKGGDPQSLFAYVRGLNGSDGAKEFIKEYRGRIAHLISQAAEDEKARKAAYKVVYPIPEDLPLPFDETHLHWRYKNTDGETIFIIERIDKADGSKLMVPHTYWSDGKQSEWRRKGFPGEKPLLGLDLLDDRPVLVVEGEKTYTAAQSLFPNFTVVTWSNGAQGISKTSWSALSNREVIIWPDNDDAGFEAAQNINKILNGRAAIVSFDRTRYPEKWDLADVEGDGSAERVIVESALAKVRAGEIVIAPRVVPVELESNGNGDPYSSVDNVMRVLAHVPSVKMNIWFDQFYQKIFVRRPDGKVLEWADTDDIELTVDIQRNTALSTVSETTVSRAVQLIAHRNVKNAPLDWLKSLKWDGVGRLNDLFEKGFGALKTDYVSDVSANFLISMVARIFDPGCKVDTMVVLEGHQGAFKSTGLSVLGGAWFMESGEAMGSKDFLQSLPGKMLIEIAELDSFSKADTRTVKKTLSCRIDRYRPSYGRYSMDFPRQCVFVGTTNEDEYLEDATGGRRFWPIRTRVVDLDWITREREQLFAEAVDRYLKGESWWEVDDSANEEQAHRRRKDSWEDDVASWIYPLALTEKSEYLLSEVAQLALGLDALKFNRNEQMRLANILKTLGCEKRHTRVGNIWKIEKVKDYVPVKKTKSRPVANFPASPRERDDLRSSQG